jgi:hypothetical protein
MDEEPAFWRFRALLNTELIELLSTAGQSSTNAGRDWAGPHDGDRCDGSTTERLTLRDGEIRNCAMGSIAQTVESILGASQVTPGESLAEPLLSAVKGAIAPESLPACVAFPTTPSEMAAVIACAHQHRWRVLPCGHGSKLSWGNRVTGADLVVSTQHLNQVIEHAEGDLTVTAQAGVAFADLQAQLLATRQFLAIDPAYPEQATLGGSWLRATPGRCGSGTAAFVTC